MVDHHIKLVTLLILCMIDSCEFVTGERCIPTEREALLKLKQGLIDHLGILSLWGSEDDKKECCNWNGVSCSNTTNHVVGLQLQQLTGEIGPSLLELHQLTTLDLSLNYFEGSKIPNFIGSMTNLLYLDLSSSMFYGIIPQQLGNLTHLTYLDLSGNHLNGSIPDSLGKLISLQTLDLSSNMLEGMIPKSVGNFSHLQYLVLEHNNLGGPLVELLGNLCCKAMLSLEYLYLSDTQLTGLVPDLNSFVSLSVLQVSGNRLTGSLPMSLGQQTELVDFEVANNSMDGIITESHFMKLHNLQILDLSLNSFRMQISPKWDPPFQLNDIFLSFCNIGPRFPTWLRGQKNMETLDLSNNGISDEVPHWLWSLFPTTTISTFLNLSYNEIHGTIPDISLIPTQTIDISSNNFSGLIPSFHPNTSLVQIQNNKFNGPISSICLNEVYPYLALFDASNNSFDGVLPNCWEKMQHLAILNLGNNFFFGQIPHSLGFLWDLQTLHLNDNYLSGVLPPTLQSCTMLKLINIQGNMLSGNIPNWIGANFSSLMFIIFRSNKFSGSIPHELCNATGIQLLDLSRNNISGKIPGCFDQLTTLVEMNAQRSPYKITIPIYGTFSSIAYQHVSRLFSDYALVQWKGQESEYYDNMGYIALIDLSSNRLVGGIPRQLFLLQGLVSLNLSRNSLTGSLDPNIGRMQMLESLDLSRNQLGGDIPSGIAQLHYLQVLDLSHNNLSGKIPTSTQLQSFNASVYDGNTQLCGLPLAPCLGNGTNPSAKSPGAQQEDYEKENGFMKLSFAQDLGISMAFGFIFGFWGIVGPLLLNKSWRITYFRFFGRIGVWLYVKTVLFLAKFRQT